MHEDDEAPALTFDAEEWRNWASTAESNIVAARREARADAHHIACVLAEQAAQCAVKALLRGVGAAEVVRGHDLVRLGRACQDQTSAQLGPEHVAALQRLTQLYLPSRYPDALPGGSPAERFGEAQSAQALEDAQLIIEVTRSTWAALQAEAGEGDADEASEPQTPPASSEGEG